MAPPLLLHIDERPDLPEGVAQALRRDGYLLEHTADPEQAMRLIEERRPALVLLEVVIESCDGLDLMAGIRDPQFGGVPVLAVTRAPRDSTIHGEAIALGVADFLTKPVRAADLLAAIREIAPAPTSDRATPEAARAKVDLSGNLADTPMPELLARLRRRGANGVLATGHAGIRVGVQLRNGSPVAVSSSRRDADQVAEVLLYETFRWEEGLYAFSEGRRLDSDATLELTGDPAGLLLAGVLDASPAGQVREGLAKRESLYVSVTQGAEAALEVEGVGLTRRQRKQLENLGGADTLSVLLASKAFDARLVYALWVGGWLELRTPPTLTLTELLGDTAELEPELDELELPQDELEPELCDLTEARPAAKQPDAEKVAAAPKQADAAAAEPSSRQVAPLQSDPAPTHGEIAPLRAAPAEDHDQLSRSLRELAERVLGGDDFEALGVSPSASDQEVRSAFEGLLQEIPEIESTTANLMLAQRAKRIRSRIKAAYANLRDEEKRRAYSLLREEEQQDRKAKPSAERALEGERWFRKGNAHLERRRWAEAVEAFGMASHLDPEQGEYSSHLGYALYLSNPTDKVVQREAMEHVASGIKRSPKHALSYVYLGRMLKAKGDVEVAKKVFLKALRIEPDFHPAVQELRVLEMRERKGKGVLGRLLRR
jgi:CheY-like chemotaxis protein/tetratricopeptide (TPR) repeat protein